MSAPLHERSVDELAIGFRGGGPTPVEVTRAALARAEDVAHLGVFEYLDVQGALAAASRAEEELRRGIDRGPRGELARQRFGKFGTKIAGHRSKVRARD